MSTSIKAATICFLCGLFLGWKLFGPLQSIKKPSSEQVITKEIIMPDQKSLEPERPAINNPPINKEPLSSEAAALKAAFDYKPCAAETPSSQTEPQLQSLYPNIQFDDSGHIKSYTDPETGETIDDPVQIEAILNRRVGF